MVGREVVGRKEGNTYQTLLSYQVVRDKTARSKFAIVVRFLLYPSRYAGTKKE
jgi:hypothetical protein